MIDRLEPTCASAENVAYDRPVPMREEDYNINIEFGLVGAALRVGCQVLYLSDGKEVLKYLSAYFEDKNKWVESYNNGTLKTLIKEVK